MSTSIKRNRSAWFVLCAMGAFTFALSAHAASFDCGKAGTKVEKLICGDAEISKLDEELNAAYKTALQDKQQADAIRQAQKQWMKGRNGCLSMDCLVRVYRSRISELSVTPTQTKATPSGVGGEEYALVMSKNDEMCNHMRQLMDDDLNQFKRTYDSHDRFVSSIEEFKAIPWKPAKASFEYHGQIHYWNVEGALFDLNNDGVLDFVVRDKSMLSGMRADSIDMLDATAAMHANNLTANELKASKNHIQIAGDGYPLLSPLGGVGLMWLLSPFIYHDTSYIYMQSLYRNDEAVGGDFVVIAKYFGGEFAPRKMTGKMEDICYIERVDVK